MLEIKWDDKGNLTRFKFYPIEALKIFIPILLIGFFIKPIKYSYIDVIYPVWEYIITDTADYWNSK